MKKIRLPRFLASGVLAAAMLVTPVAAFTDTEGHWAEEAINKWSEQYQLIQGYDDGTFRPDNSINSRPFPRLIPFLIRRGATGRRPF